MILSNLEEADHPGWRKWGKTWKKASWNDELVILMSQVLNEQL